MTETKPHVFVGRLDRWCERCNLPDRNPIHVTSEPIDFSPLELNNEVALSQLDERLPVIVETLRKLKPSTDRRFLEYTLNQQIKSLAYILQDLLVTSGKERATGALDSVAATLGEVGKELYTALTGEQPEDESERTTGRAKKVAR